MGGGDNLTRKSEGGGGGVFGGVFGGVGKKGWTGQHESKTNLMLTLQE